MISRGEIWWASLPRPVGSGPGYRRPVLVVQAEAFNRSRIGTVVVATISSNMALAAAPGNVALTKRQSGLPKPSVVNVSQILTLDRTTLTDPVRALGRREMGRVGDGLRLILGL